MTAHRTFNAAQREEIKRLANEYAQDTIHDMLHKNGYFWCLAMRQAGLSITTVNRVCAKMPAVTAKYESWKADNIQDEFLRLSVEDSGIGKE